MINRLAPSILSLLLLIGSAQSFAQDCDGALGQAIPSKARLTWDSLKKSNKKTFFMFGKLLIGRPVVWVKIKNVTFIQNAELSDLTAGDREFAIQMKKYMEENVNLEISPESDYVLVGDPKLRFSIVKETDGKIISGRIEYSQPGGMLVDNIIDKDADVSWEAHGYFDMINGVPTPLEESFGYEWSGH